MGKVNKYIKELFWGIIAKVLNFFIPVKKKHWVLGSDFGNSYREGSKYLIEYILANHKDVTCTFVTMNQHVYDELRKSCIPCVMNHTLEGIIRIAEADAIFTTQYTNDILYVYKKKNRSFYYMVHGQSYKKGYDLEKKLVMTESVVYKLKCLFSRFFLVGYDIHDVSFMPVTSDYVGEFMSQCFSRRVPMKVLGMPRNDALFDPLKMCSEKWLSDITGKYVITYMPTHRGYGKGELSPIPFINDDIKQKWLHDNNVVLLIKHHPNMIPKIVDDIQSDVIKDISKLRFDPMTVIYHTNLLITDYSSVWMDFLLLQRPILFYFYDNFEEEDTDLFFSVKDIASDYCCYDEDVLFDKIRRIVSNLDAGISKGLVFKFHKYPDGKSCERYYNAIMDDKYGDVAEDNE